MNRPPVLKIILYSFNFAGVEFQLSQFEHIKYMRLMRRRGLR